MVRTSPHGANVMDTTTQMDQKTPARLSDFAPIDGPLTVADLIAIGTRSIGIARLMPDAVMPVVVDANVLIEDLLRVADGKHSSLLLSALLGSARLYATEAILGEVDEHLPGVAAKKARDVPHLREVLQQQYLPNLRLVDVSDLTSEDDRVQALELEDPDDVDAAKLAILLSPSFLLTASKDHLRHGLGVIFDPSEGRTGWTFGAVALQDRGLIIGVLTGGTGSVLGAGYAGMLAVDGLKAVSSNERLMTAGLVLLVGIALALALSPRARTRAAELANSVGAIAADAAAAVARGVGTAIDWSEEARALFEQNAIRRPASDTDLERVARTLAVSRPGVSVAELRAVQPDIPNVNALLASSRMFVQVGQGRWALGRSASSVRQGHIARASARPDPRK